MKRLILIRHAKSDWNNQFIDHDRPIKKSGVDKSVKVSKKLKEILDFPINKIYSSTAIRAKETAQIFVFELGENYIVDYQEQLYTFSLMELTKFIKGIPDTYENVMMFGHNEAYTDFVNKYGNQEIKNLSTSGVACIEFNIDTWSELKKGKTKWILLPKDLSDEQVHQ